MADVDVWMMVLRARRIASEPAAGAAVGPKPVATQQ
jgi:hypothetical protein